MPNARNWNKAAVVACVVTVANFATLALCAMMWSASTASATQTAGARVAALEAEVEDLREWVDYLSVTTLPPALQIPAGLNPWGEYALISQGIQEYPDLTFDLVCPQTGAPFSGSEAVTLQCVRVARIAGMPMPDWAQ